MDVAEKRSRAQARVEAARRRGDTAEVAKWEAYLATLPAADSAPAAAAPPPELPAKKPAPPAPAPARSPAPAPVPVVAPKPALPPAAKPMPARVELVREAPQVIDVSGAKAAKADVVKTAPETQSVLQQQLIAKGMRPDVAEQVAKDQVARVLRDAAGARGDAGPADATLLPFAKGSQIVPYLAPTHNDPPLPRGLPPPRRRSRHPQGRRAGVGGGGAQAPAGDVQPAAR